MKVQRTATVAKEIQSAASGKLPLPVEPGLTQFQSRLWADVMMLRGVADWNEGDRPYVIAYVQAWAAYNGAKDLKVKREWFVHIREIAAALKITIEIRAKRDGKEGAVLRTMRAKQMGRAVSALSSNNVDRLLATPTQ